jgi:hypothetical protein
MTLSYEAQVHAVKALLCLAFATTLLLITLSLWALPGERPWYLLAWHLTLIGAASVMSFGMALHHMVDFWAVTSTPETSKELKKNE